jgi:hypothetical protein
MGGHINRLDLGACLASRAQKQKFTSRPFFLNIRSPQKYRVVQYFCRVWGSHLERYDEICPRRGLQGTFEDVEKMDRNFMRFIQPARGGKSSILLTSFRYGAHPAVVLINDDGTSKQRTIFRRILREKPGVCLRNCVITEVYVLSSEQISIHNVW